MGNLLQDLRFGVRMLLKHPGFTLIAVLTLALGIGANTAIFSIVNAVLLRQLPYPEPGRLVMLWSTMQSQGVSTSGSSLPDYREWRDQNHVFEGLAGFYHDAVYDIGRADNEERSARWAHEALVGAGAPQAAAERVAALVLATRHAAPATGPDARLVVDIDLAILGAPEERFAQYERQIRAEYAAVPQSLFREKRRAVLRSFIQRPHIYATHHFRQALEARARAQLARAIVADDPPRE